MLTFEVTLSSVYLRTSGMELMVCWRRGERRIWSYQRSPGSLEIWAGQVRGIIEHTPAAAASQAAPQ